MTKLLSYLATAYLCCLLTLQANAQSVVLENKHELYKVEAASLKWFIDTTGRLDLAAIQQISFAPFSSVNLSKPKTSWNTWAYFILSNKTGADQEMVLQIPRSGYATAFVQRGNAVTSLRTGSLLPLKERSLQASISAFVLDVKTQL